MKQAALLFVYNADSGLFNLLADIGHKVFSPQTYACDLCALTHGVFSERSTWRSFIEQLGCDCRFMHRDEFAARYPAITTPLPAVFRIDGEALHCCLDATAIAALPDLQALQAAVTACRDTAPGPHATGERP